MDVAREIQIHSMAFAFAGLRMAGSIPGWLKNRVVSPKSLDFDRDTPPDCLSDPMQGRHLFVKINDTKYHYVECGSRRHQLVLCLHDFADFWYGWRAQLRGLSNNCWVVAPDLKGFGDSEKPFLASNYTDTVILEELRKFVELVQGNDRQIVLIGHGLGGYIAWKFVEKYPDIVAKFIPIATPHPTVWLRHVMRSWRSVYENRFLYMCRLPYLPETDLLANDIEVIKQRRTRSSSVADLANFSQLDEEAYKYTFCRAIDWRGPVNYYRNLPLTSSSVISADPPNAVSVETLFMVGNMDPEVSLDLVSRSSEYVDKFAVKIIDGAGHSPQQEKPEIVNKHLIKFIKDDLSYMTKWAGVVTTASNSSPSPKHRNRQKQLTQK